MIVYYIEIYIDIKKGGKETRVKVKAINQIKDTNLSSCFLATHRKKKRKKKWIISTRLG
jgi:hypothetical protein